MEATKSSRRATDRRSQPDTQATRRSEWLVRRRFSTRSLPSLALLEEGLTDLQRTNALYLSDELSRASASLSPG